MNTRQKDDLLLKSRQKEIMYSIPSKRKSFANPLAVAEIVCDTTQISIQQIESGIRIPEIVSARTMMAAYLSLHTNLNQYSISTCTGTKRSSVSIALKNFPKLRYPEVLTEANRKFVDHCVQIEELIAKIDSAPVKEVVNDANATKAHSVNLISGADYNAPRAKRKPIKAEVVNIDAEFKKLSEVHSTDIRYKDTQLRAKMGFSGKQMEVALSYKNKKDAMFIRMPMYDFVLLFDDVISMIQTPELVKYFTSTDYQNKEDRVNTSSLKIDCTFEKL